MLSFATGLQSLFEKRHLLSATCNPLLPCTTLNFVDSRQPDRSEAAPKPNAFIVVSSPLIDGLVIPSKMARGSMNSLYQSVLSGRTNLSSISGNRTEPGIVPSQLFESIIPGYGPIHNFILLTFGLDITILVTLFATLWGLFKLWKYVWGSIYSFISDYFMSSIAVTSFDDIHSHMIKWLAAQPELRTSRSLMAETDQKSAWEVEEEDLTNSSDSSGSNFLNFANQESKAPPRFVPAFGTHRFWHNGTYFRLQRAHSTSVEDRGFIMAAEKETLTISCFGRSPAPIKSLLQTAKTFYLQEHEAKTVIRRPAPKEMRRHGGRYCWNQVASRPCRPMETVVLEANRKSEVLNDINEYLHPATPHWYANRGIPYRRGYLFHGPPGTGKSSLSFALAGIFGLDIYVISLLESTLTEEDLSQLFTTLPRRCIVLLEDIDSAGLMRMDDPNADAATDTKSVDSGAASAAEGWKIVSADISKALRKSGQTSKDEEKKGISLSGLLNAIDGVASHEGRVLIMTTNKPESLDSALIRPGRVDLQVAFGNASSVQIKELFERMYTSDMPRTRRHAVTDNLHMPSTDSNSPGNMATSISKSPLNSSESKNLQKTARDTIVEASYGYPDRTLEDCAKEFADTIPDGKFSPAEIQGFLLKRKKEPQRACGEIKWWVEGMVGAQEEGVKVLQVQ